VATTRRTSQRITLVMLVLASITVLTLDYHGEVNRGITHVRNGVADAISPFQRGVAAALHPVGDVFSGAVHYGSLEEQNARLRTELGETQRRIAANEQASSAARVTLSLQHLSYLAGLQGTLAEVLSGPTSNFADTIELDKGTASGVGPGMPVVSGRGLVGTVEFASSHTSTVRLVTDPAEKIAVRVSGTSAAWRTVGTGLDSPLTVRYLPASTTTTAGARSGGLIETSGLDQGAYPAGIPVATVRTVYSGLDETLSATPIVNLDNLQYVTVLDWLAPA
jgi:rod shape-determining protein MreC